ncbi:MAG: DUF4743 domain-containing protein [Alphaproteobacteria bacterium]|nr:DUF4743 domain-containing protein [Alphaproteobacteria bacterium]
MNLNKLYNEQLIRCNRHDLSEFVPFVIGTQQYGFIRKKNAELLSGLTKFFEYSSIGLALSDDFDTFGTRSAALNAAVIILSKTYNKPLRNEMYPVLLAFNGDMAAEIDRCAIPFFGLLAFGVHVNGYVRKKDGLYVWIGKRAKNRQIEPGKLDNLIGGGLPIGLSVEENLYKEAKEEAGISPEIAKKAVFIKNINYRFELEEGIRNDSIFVYDLELDENFTPKNTDGEVEEFRLMPAKEVINFIEDNSSFKFNCSLIVADFLLRHSA